MVADSLVTFGAEYFQLTQWFSFDGGASRDHCSPALQNGTLSAPRFRKHLQIGLSTAPN